MKSIVKGLALAAALTVSTVTAEAWAPGQMEVPLDIYQWVQSTDRMNYYLNKQKISYAVDKDGNIDFYTLLVPVMKSYDGIQVKDIIERRRWNNLSTEGFENLAGETNFMEINLLKETILLKKVEYLTFGKQVLETQNPEQTTDVAKLPEMHVERRFFEGIELFETKHFDTVIQNTKGGKLSEEEMKQLVKERKKAHKEIEKRDKK